MAQFMSDFFVIKKSLMNWAISSSQLASLGLSHLWRATSAPAFA